MNTELDRPLGERTNKYMHVISFPVLHLGYRLKSTLIILLYNLIFDQLHVCWHLRESFLHEEFEYAIVLLITMIHGSFNISIFGMTRINVRYCPGCFKFAYITYHKGRYVHLGLLKKYELYIYCI